MGCVYLAAVLPARAARAQAGDLSVGALYPLTGAAAAFGIQQSNGLKLAAQFVNQEGGVKGRQVKFIFGDATNNATAVAGAERLVQSGVPMIFGTASSGLSLAASPVAERAGIVYVETGALNAALTSRGFKHYFRTRANNDIFARRSIAITKEVIAPKLGKQPAQMTAVVLHEDGPFGTELGKFVPDAAKELGGPRILAVNGYNIAETKNFTPLILRYQSLKPDVIYWAAYTSDAILFWRQAKERGYTPPSTVAYTSGPGTPDFLKAMGPEGSNGVLVLDVPLRINPAGMKPEAGALLTRFEKAYKEAYPDQPLTGNAVVGFVGGWIVLKYVLPQAAEFTPAGIRAALQKTDVPEGTLPTGWGAKFDEHGQNVRAFPIGLEWQSGELVPVWPKTFARADAKHLPLAGSK